MWVSAPALKAARDGDHERPPDFFGFTGPVRIARMAVSGQYTREPIPLGPHGPYRRDPGFTLLATTEPGVLFVEELVSIQSKTVVLPHASRRQQHRNHFVDVDGEAHLPPSFLVRATSSSESAP